MLYNRKIDRAVIIIVPVALFVYLSTRPRVRLRADMPPDFAEVAQIADPAQRAREVHLAQEYWNCALNVIQWKFTYGSPLPDNPPDEFRSGDASSKVSDISATSRVRYWERLRKAWLMPKSWTTSRQWSTDWLTNPIRDAWRWTESYFRDLFSRS